MAKADREAAERIAERAKKIEPAITSALEDIVSEIEEAGLVDLGSRLKKIDRIEEKVSIDSVEKGSREIAEAALFDALRYTVVITDDYGATINRIIEALSRRGITLVRSKNSWGHDGYQAINAVFRDPAGIPFEVQFHTPDSRDKRNGAHDLYEQLRDPATDAVELDDVIGRTIAVWRPVCSRPPSGATSIPNLP